MMGMSPIAVVLMAILGGGGNDLLDYVPAKAFWRSQGVEVSTAALLGELKPTGAKAGDVAALIKQLGSAEQPQREQAQRRLAAMGPAVLPAIRKAAKSSDAEVAVRAKALIEEIAKRAAARGVRRLMAIRTLGERKDAKALPPLRGLLKSKAAFEAEYARAAMAAIEGKAFKRPAASAKAMEADLWLLPGNCAAVGQYRLPAGRPIRPGQLAKMLAPMIPDDQAEKMLARMNEALISVAVQIGNVRVDGVTFGVADDVSDDSGHVVFVIRGLYDPAAVRAIVIDKLRLQPEKVGQIELLRVEGNAAVILAGEDRLVFLAGPTREKLPVKEIAAALKAGKGGLGANKAMADLIKSTDRTGPVWAACRVTEAYRKAPLLAAFQTIALTSKQKPKELHLTLSARGSDVVKVARAVNEFNAYVAEARRETDRMVERMPAIKPLADFLGTIKVAADAAGATVIARLAGDPKSLLGIPAMMWSASDAPAPAAEGLAPPVPVPAPAP